MRVLPFLVCLIAACANAQEVSSTNYLVSDKELTREELLAKLGWPVDVMILPSSDPSLPIPAQRKTMSYSVPFGSKLFEQPYKAQITRQPGEKTLDFARRVSLALRSQANLGFSDLLTPYELSAFKVLGRTPVLCNDLALAFNGIMSLNGIWSEVINCRANDGTYDTHVSSQIYLAEEDRWAVVDSSFVGVFKGPDDRLLSAAEVQALGPKAQFSPFEPKAGYHEYYIQPLSQLFTRIEMDGELRDNVSDYLLKNPLRRKFLVEKHRVGAAHVYFWRSSLSAPLTRSPQLSASSASVLLDLPCTELPQRIFGKIASAGVVESGGEKFFRTNTEGGGVCVESAFSKGGAYVFEAVLRVNKGLRRHAVISFQDSSTQQWTNVRDQEWATVSYFFLSDGSPGKFYIYNDDPAEFDIKSIRIRAVAP